MKFLHNLITKIEPPNWVLGILALITIFRIPSLIGPYYYGDEMIYLTLGNAIRKGITLYSQIHDNKPPLLYLTAAIAGNLFWFRAILMFWMLATTIVFWHLVKTLFEKNVKAQQVSVVVFAILTTIPLLEGQIANAELFLIGPIILGILLLLKKPSYKNIIFAGLSFSVAALFKIPAAFDLPVVFLFWLITTKNSKDLIETIKKTVVLVIAFLIPITLSFVWYAFKGALPAYLNAAFLQNLGYVSSWNAGGNTSFVVKHGPMLIRAAIVVIGLIALRVSNKKLSNPFLISAIWILTSLFAVTLSERPYPHYLIQAIPAVSVMIAILVSSERFEQVLAIIPLGLAIFVPVYYHFWYYPTVPYYQNFIKFATGQENKWQYFNTTDRTTQENYSLSQQIVEMTSPNDKIFVWGDEAPTIYALTRRLPAIKYVANYHITDFSSLEQASEDLKSNPPTLIIFLPKSPAFKELNPLLIKKYILVSNPQNSIQIWKQLAN